MDKQPLISAVTLSDILLQKLQGLINKIDTSAEIDEDKLLAKNVQAIFKLQTSIGQALSDMKENRWESKIFT